jgi:hypothetical protein
MLYCIVASCEAFGRDGLGKQLPASKSSSLCLEVMQPKEKEVM